MHKLHKNVNLRVGSALILCTHTGAMLKEGKNTIINVDFLWCSFLPLIIIENSALWEVNSHNASHPLNPLGRWDCYSTHFVCVCV